MASTLVSIAVPSLARAVFFPGVGAHNFVKRGPGVAGLPQYAPQALLGLLGGTGAAQDDGHLDFRQIDALIEDLVGDQGGIAAVGQSLQDLRPLLLLAMAEQAGDEKAA